MPKKRSGFGIPRPPALGGQFEPAPTPAPPPPPVSMAPPSAPPGLAPPSAPSAMLPPAPPPGRASAPTLAPLRELASRARAAAVRPPDPPFDLQRVGRAIAGMSPEAAQRALALVGLATGERDAGLQARDLATRRATAAEKVLADAEEALAKGDFERAKLLIESSRKDRELAATESNRRADNERADADLWLRGAQFGYRQDRDRDLDARRREEKAAEAERWEKEFRERRFVNDSLVERRAMMAANERYKQALEANDPGRLFDATKELHRAARADLKSLRGQLNAAQFSRLELDEDQVQQIRDAIEATQARVERLQLEMLELAQPTGAARPEDYSPEDIAAEIARRAAQRSHRGPAERYR